MEKVRGRAVQCGAVRWNGPTLTSGLLTRCMPAPPQLCPSLLLLPLAHAACRLQKIDPYMPFEDAVDVWARTFAALGIRYRGATMNLDLLDREMKYSNGFCHCECEGGVKHHRMRACCHNDQSRVIAPHAWRCANDRALGTENV